MIINLAITQEPQIRAWLGTDIIKDLEKNNVVHVWLPKNLEERAKKLTQRKCHYYDLNFSSYTNQLYIKCINIDHKKIQSFRNSLKIELLPEPLISISGIHIYIKKAIGKLLRNRELIALLIFKAAFQKALKKIDIEIEKNQVNFSESDINIVVSSYSDLSNEAIINSLSRTQKPMIQVVDNWDNISSKVCPTKKAEALVVWGAQTKRHASEIHNFPIDKIYALGSSRLAKQIFDNLKKEITGVETNINAPIKLFYAGFGAKHETLDFFDKLLNDFNLDGSNFQLTVRPHPTAQRNSFVESNTTFPKMLRINFPKIDEEIDPIWPTLDGDIYRDLIEADIVIGTPSTLILEAMLLNKKIIIDYRRIKSIHSPRKVFRTRKHFLEILNNEDIPKLRKSSDLNSVAEKIIQFNQNYKETIEDIVSFPNVSYGIDLSELAKKIVESG
jgi:hypothetical protein